MTVDNVRSVDALKPDPETIQKAACVIRTGGLVVFPTSGLYGIAGDATRAEAVERVFSLKQRPPEKPVLILIRDMVMLDQVAASVPESARRIMNRFWPGGVTLVLPAAEILPEVLTAGSGTVGVRLPVHPVAAALMKAAGCPITATSANLSGQPGCSSIDRLSQVLRDGAELVLDVGPLAGSASTVVAVTGSDIRILREGRIPAREIHTATKKG